jgi:hypothetical protein
METILIPLFEVGEIAIAIADESLTPIEQNLRYSGEECTVLKVFTNHTIQTATAWKVFPFAYLVQFGDDETLTAAPHELRKKEPPKKEVSDLEWAKNKVKDLLVINPLITDPVEETAEA